MKNQNRGRMFNHSDVLDQFKAAMAAHGISTRDEIIADGHLHRFHVDGDRPASRNGWYILYIDDHPAGQFGCKKRLGDEKLSWSMKGATTSKMTQEERNELRRVAEQRRAQRAKDDAARQAAAADRAKQVWANAKPTESHPYLQRKQVASHGLRVGAWERTTADGTVHLVTGNALLVPIMDRSRNIRSLQAIFPKEIGGRDKDYLYGGEKRGLFYGIGKPQEFDGRKVFVIAEGYATAASVHECTGHCVLTCFDTSNLLPVARQIRERQPDAIIVFAADNDQWTHQPVENPGVHFATIAAMEVGGIVIEPQFQDLTDRPTDWNDLHVREGDWEVTRQFETGLRKMRVAAQPEPDHDHSDEPSEEIEPDAPEWVAGDLPPPELPPQDRRVVADVDPKVGDLARNGHFTLLGYDQGDFYLFVHEKRQVVRVTKSDFSDIGLIELAPADFWQGHFPAEKAGIDRKAVANWFFRAAHQVGIYDPTHVRGRGAWVDDGRHVFHYGSYLTVDGVPTRIEHIRSKYVYPMAKSMPEPSDAMLSDSDGRHLLRVASMVRWSKPASAALMAGWVMLAPICGSIAWRPHIWITGGAGSGKTSVQRDFCAALTSGYSVYAQGNSTEAGIRQRLRADALPVLIDEMESNNEVERKRVESIIAMIRQSSSETPAETLKGTIGGDAMRFHIRSMFCVVSINTALDKKADIDRLTRLVIRPPIAANGSDDHWRKLSDELHKIKTDADISRRLVSRALRLQPVIHENIRVFTRVGAQEFGTQRDGDQFGTLLAGCWCLCNSRVATEDEARNLIRHYDWEEHTEDHEQDDAVRALGALIGAKLRVGTLETSVFELVREASPLHSLGKIDASVALDTLSRHGIRPCFQTNTLMFGMSVPNLKQLVDRTDFVSDLRGQLLRINGARRIEKTVKMNGVATRAVGVPLGPILEDEAGPGETEQIPF